MSAEIHSGPSVVIFCPDGTETSTIKRAQGFTDHGYGVTILSFRRGRYNRDYVAPWAPRRWFFANRRGCASPRCCMRAISTSS
jgi:hypothetical protein